MNSRNIHRILLAGLSVGVMTSTGCRHCCNKKPLFGRSETTVGPFLGAPVAPGATIPPPGVPTTPAAPPPVIPDSSGSLRVDPAYPPPAFPPASPPPPAVNRSFPPPANSPTPPTPSNKTGPELLLPDPLPPKSSSAYGQTPPPALEDPLLPRSSEKPPSSVPLPSGGTDLPPAPMPNQPSSGSAPVGLSSYTAVADEPGVYTGRRPSLDGIDWLKANGFHTVLLLHAPDVDPSAARDLVEKRGLKFESIAVSPASLSDTIERFNGTLANRLNRPLYVADDDGWRGGMLWYLRFRTSGLLGDDAARVRARPLGLPTTESELGKEFWAAAQQYLVNR